MAWHPLGWSPAFFSEIDSFPCAALAHHYPDVPNYGDMTQFEEWPNVSIDVLVGGTPCQSFSVAGLRKGLDDPRGNLMLTFGAIASRYRPEWLVWENVPGVPSSNGGRDFGAFLGMLAVLGYGFAYRILDAQYAGLAQRRKRVFVVASARGWQRAAAVLFERHSLSGHPAPSREARQGIAHDVAPCPTGSGRGVERTGDSRGQDCVVPTLARCDTTGEGHRLDYETTTLVCPTLRAGGNATGGDRPPGTDVDTADSLIVAHSLRGEGFDASEDQTGRGTPLVPVHAFDARQSDVIQYGDKSGPLDTDGHSVAVAFDPYNQACAPVTHTLRKGRSATGDEIPQTVQNMQVRRLTPVKCERLQGFPDGYTAIPWRNKPSDQCPDGPRYKALGNSMAVPVVRWIGQRINQVMEIT